MYVLWRTWHLMGKSIKGCIYLILWSLTLTLSLVVFGSSPKSTNEIHPLADEWRHQIIRTHDSSPTNGWLACRTVLSAAEKSTSGYWSPKRNHGVTTYARAQGPKKGLGLGLSLSLLLRIPTSCPSAQTLRVQTIDSFRFVCFLLVKNVLCVEVKYNSYQKNILNNSQPNLHYISSVLPPITFHW